MADDAQPKLKTPTSKQILMCIGVVFVVVMGYIFVSLSYHGQREINQGRSGKIGPTPADAGAIDRSKEATDNQINEQNKGNGKKAIGKALHDGKDDLPPPSKAQECAMYGNCEDPGPTASGSIKKRGVAGIGSGRSDRKDAEDRYNSKTIAIDFSSQVGEKSTVSTEPAGGVQPPSANGEAQRPNAAPAPDQSVDPETKELDKHLLKFHGKQYRIEPTPVNGIWEGVLLNRLNSDGQGPAWVMITTAVKDHSMTRVLVPRGTILVGEMRNMGTQGNNRRVAVTFKTTVMPDGFQKNMMEFQAQDQQGATGLTGKVNHHYLERFGASIAIGALGALSQLDNSYGGYGYDAGAQMRNGITTRSGQAAEQILERGMNTVVTQTIFEGTIVRVFITQGFWLPAYENHDMDPDL